MSNMNFLYHYIFIICQLWLTSHPRSTRTPDTSREIYREDANDNRGVAGSSPIIEMNFLIADMI